MHSEFKISEEQKNKYHDEGHFVLPPIVSGD
jgi:hypothetical protein